MLLKNIAASIILSHFANSGAVEQMDLLAIWFLLIFGVFVPYVAFQSGRRVRAGAPVPPRKRIFINVLVMQILFLSISLLTTRFREIDLFAAGKVSRNAIILAIGMLGIGLGVMPLFWRRSSEDEKRQTLLARPNEPKDLGWWFLVSLAAGTVEEITYRGVMFALLLPMTRNRWMAAAICVSFFALGHANQKLSRMTFIGAIAIGCHALVWMTGALYLAMAMHFTYDFIAGIIYLRWARQMSPAG